MSPKKAALSILCLSLVGLALAGWLILIHVRVHTDPTYAAVCAVSQEVNCETVAASPYSVFAGLPVAVIGAIAYLVMALLAASDHQRGDGPGTAGLMAFWGLGAAVVSVVLALISSLVIGAFCLVCTATYIVNFAIAAVAVLLARGRGGLIDTTLEEVRSLAKSRPSLVYAGTVAAMVLAAGPGGGFPRYWELASWRGGLSMQGGVDEKGHHWLGARKPKLVVHEYFDYDCPGCRASHVKLRRILSRHPTSLRIVRHDLPRTRCSSVTRESHASRCIPTRAAHCAGLVGRFWEWNDAVSARPYPRSKPDRISYVLDLSKRLGFEQKSLDRCLFDENTVEYAERMRVEGRRLGVRATPTYRVGDELLDLKELVQLIEKRL